MLKIFPKYLNLVNISKNCIHVPRPLWEKKCIRKIQRTREAFLQMLNFQTGRKRYSMMQHNQLWLETMWDTRKEDETKELWKKEFRMSVEKFQYLLDLIGINVQRLDNRF